MKPETSGKIKYGIWGTIAGAVVAMVIGFAWGGWMTTKTNQDNVETALISQAAKICAYNFTQDPGYKVNIVALEEISSYSRRDYIEKGSWAKSAGADPMYGVTNACADLLNKLM